MIAVSTGEQSIKYINEYITKYQEINKTLKLKDLENPNPYSDLGKWRGKWSSGDLPDYKSRREYIRNMYNPLLNKLNYMQADKNSNLEDLVNSQVEEEISIVNSFKDNKVEPSKLNNIRTNGDNMNRKVFVIYGRDEKTTKAFYEFFRSIDLQPIEWEQAIELTGKASPYIGDILEAGLNNAKAIVVLFTPDEMSILREEYTQNKSEKNPVFQPRPNVIFEAGMAIDKDPNRTIIIEIGEIREISDIAGRHVVRFDDTFKKRKELIVKLKNAGCELDDSGSDWHKAGDFTHIIRNKQEALEEIENFKKHAQLKKDYNKFKLYSAIYGTDEYFFDVYDKLNSMVNKNGLKVTSSNKIAGDPHKKAKKKLIIRYESYGKEYKIEVPERETRTLP